MISCIDKELPIIFLNTQKLFRETIDYRDKIIRHFSLKNVKEVFPNKKELESNDPKGFLWKKIRIYVATLGKLNP